MWVCGLRHRTGIAWARVNITARSTFANHGRRKETSTAAKILMRISSQNLIHRERVARHFRAGQARTGQVDTQLGGRN